MANPTHKRSQRRSLRAIREKLLNMGELTDLADHVEGGVAQMIADDFRGQA